MANSWSIVFQPLSPLFFAKGLIARNNGALSFVFSLCSRRDDAPSTHMNDVHCRGHSHPLISASDHSSPPPPPPTHTL